jgi:hypothetical protein
MDGSGRNRLYFGSDAGGRANRMRRITTLFAGGALALSLFGVAAAGTLEDDTAHLIAE